MFEFIYQCLQDIGYTHPLHPPMTHVPVGLTIGAFIFGLGAFLLRRSSLSNTAHHCTILALIGLFPTVLLGYMDWQHNFAGAWIFPIKMKFILACVLLVLLVIAAILGRDRGNGPRNVVGIHLLCLLTVIVLGYFGGELVYGKKPASEKLNKGLAQEGAAVFSQKCSACHHTDSTASKIGPGLKGLFEREKLQASGLPVTEANVLKQVKEPVGKMPPFAALPEEELKALIAYMKTL
jgi:uncharacterized membrane protein